MRVRRRRRRLAGWWFAVNLVCGSVSAGEPSQSPHPPADLTAISLEELAKVEVTSVGKKQQKLSEAAAAVYVITQEDIYRSGLTSIPELLRMAPGLEVARIDGNKWAITARGFNDRRANKVLVVIDGRSVYTPLFSGVYWDQQDLMLEDIERIEVIRGPGAILWGANAVNGVINIITKPARETQGGLATAGGGDKERGGGAFRWGGTLGPKIHYRAYTKYFKRETDWERHSGPGDRWEAVQGGFRLDWEASARDSVTVQGDLVSGNTYELRSTALFSPPYRAPLLTDQDRNGGNVLGRWRRAVSDTSEMTLQFYYDRTSRVSQELAETRSAFDVDFQYRFAPSGRHEILWGLGSRFSGDDIRGSFTVSFDPPARSYALFTGFVQDEIALVPSRLHLVLGSQFEHNAFSGFEARPGIRLLWSPDARNTGWVSLSRAVRIPSRSDLGLRVNFAVFPDASGSPTVLALLGNPNSRSEGVVAYELGYRVQASRQLSLDLAGFYNQCDNLSTLERGVPFVDPAPAPHRVIPEYFNNRAAGHTFGLEAAARWNVSRYWKLSGGYSWLRMRLHPGPDSRDPSTGETAGRSPQHQFNLRSYLDLPRHFQLDTAVYYADRLPTGNIASRYRLDTRLGWRPTRILDFSAGFDDLLQSRHAEFLSSDSSRPIQVGRSLYGKVTWRF